MNFLKKLFGASDKKTDAPEKKNPENTKLSYLLNIWGQYPSDENYKAVMEEVLNGSSFLLLPSVNDGAGSGDWKTTETETTLTLTSVYNIDGLQVLGVFSDENALLEWSKKETQYTAMGTQDLIQFCKQHGIDRIVINSDQKNMYILERNRENIKTTVVEKETQVLVGSPARPLNKQILDKLITNFKKVDTIEEAYQYAQSLHNETSIVLGIKMTIVSDNSRAALHNALNNSLRDEQLDMPLDIMVLESEDWLQTVRNIENSLFYKR